ncbi:MAG TPA: dehydrogenase, partial [Tahibacter sp.]|nr:dehydrogenase [Tahibacter sp.]
AFWRMLADILRFNRHSVAWLEAHPEGRMTLRDFLREGAYSRAFADWYLLPMAAAIWSCPAGQMLDYPLATFVRFCRNHGLLQVFDRPQWRSIVGGGREYVRKLAAGIDHIRLATPVRQVRRVEFGALVETDHDCRLFDDVVLACHSDQALALLGDADAREREILGAITYQPNDVVLHTDARLLPRSRSAWAAWNAYVPAEPDAPCSVSYCMNLLQGIASPAPFVVTLNRTDAIDAQAILARRRYAHPVYSHASVAAQARKAEIQGRRRTWFAGAYWGWGFHEDGMRSAVDVARDLGMQWNAAPAAQAAL